MSKNTESRNELIGGGPKTPNRLVEASTLFDACPDKPLNGAEIGIATKALLSDYVRGKASLISFREIIRALNLAVNARKVQLLEFGGLLPRDDKD